MVRRRREGFVGVIVPHSDHARLATGMLLRYQASADALQRRMPPRSHSVANISGLGVSTWPQLVNILRDAASSDALDPAERLIAQRTVTWYDQAVDAMNRDVQWS